MPNQDDVDPADIELYETFKSMPLNMVTLVKAVGFAAFEDMDPEEQKVYDKAREGKCMTCDCALAETGNFIVTKQGIVAAYCSGVCHSDMAVLGYLQEQHAEISDRIEFREGGGSGGNADQADDDGEA